MRTHFEILALACLSLLVWFLAGEARGGDFRDAQRRVARYREAEARRLPEVEADFRDAGAAWPPRGLYLRAYKLEGVVELWAPPARGTRYVRVRTFPICMASGVLGPKTQEGDLQVPEGLYEVQAFNPHSRFHLSLKVSYPNADDRRRAALRGVPTGGDIMVHGSCVTIGCLPLRDGPVEALYVAAVHARDRGAARIPIHIHPCRYSDATCRETLAAEPVWATHWGRLAVADALFESEGTPTDARRLAALAPGL